MFYDWETNNSALKQWKWRSWVFRLFRKQVVVYGVSIDVRDEQSLQIIRDIFSSVQAIYVRDVSSQESLGAL
ncbi:MAG: polysaccharide pyruvyl transferase family protein [Candidatus Peribacteria bacterium]|nr:MAG: polysaccharide pyruvyl transferase family protein [Candidatus Peribacteria bacterium]